ncbi:MAG: alpha/beta hydrolase fold domain-containing protein, partial [Myxococcales bacterium]|nr:alpha/beta hydrolase fold domain-containing protein [Myxococcales bacterium]
MSALGTLKTIAASVLAVTRERRRGETPSPRWSWAFHVGVRYLRDGFLHLDSLPVAEHRAEMEKIGFADPAMRKVEVTATTIAGRPAERTRPKGRAPTRAVLYLHGGSYHYGSPRTHRPLIARLAALADAEVVAIDYRLAPEAPFPAG